MYWKTTCTYDNWVHMLILPFVMTMLRTSLIKEVRVSKTPNYNIFSIIIVMTKPRDP